ncbi:hypothetical protein ACIA98_17005 [Streptomyces sp. NPDC051366]|uniref:hypothetical protein n=1 Tax=Streptomyces sp. NPDC051366 TaxID=3365652 RepID=UPI00378EDA2B
MYLPARAGRSTALLLSASLVTVLAGGLAGCSLIDPHTSCEGSEPRLKELSALTILDAKPPQATPPPDYADVETDCSDGSSSGDAWLHAGRIYSFPGSKTEVLAYYTKAAAADGWKLEENTSARQAPVDVEGLCFSKGDDGKAMHLSIEFRIMAMKPGPDFGTGTGFTVSVGAEVDGTKTPCWE